jgi:glucose/arabinose dehydrogenase
LAPKGFSVNKFADELEHPRWLYIADNWDIFVADSNTILKAILKIDAKISRKIKTQHIGENANRIIPYRDADKNGIPKKSYVSAGKLK